MSTELFYQYRDYGGYKESETVVFPDDPKQEDIDLILRNLLDGEYFIPSQVGMADLQERLADGKPLGKDDHVEHSIVKVGFTQLAPTTTIFFSDFAKLFASTQWDLLKAMEDHGLSCARATSYLSQYIE